MIKHVGKHGDRKVAIVFREVPGEEHMCLVVYTETLPVAMHDALMRALESPVCQTAENLGDGLFRELFSDGRPMLQTLHAEGMLKKAQTKQVVVTPNPSSHVNLSEMNEIIRKMKLGESAVRELADLDSNRGMTGKVRPRDQYGREIGAPMDSTKQGSSAIAGSNASRNQIQADLNSALDDSVIANNLRAQAERMNTEAQQLMAESARLLNEASSLSGAAPVTAPKSTRGRPKKAVANAVNQ
jgi:hypothetical protein